MFFMISFTAVKAIANAIKYVILSTIKYNTHFHKGAETAATVPLQIIAHIFTLNKYQYAQIIRLNIVVNIVHRIRKGESDNQYDRNAIAVYAR